ncbi:hypothetical protein D3C71_1068700 [compost metagenome]
MVVVSKDSDPRIIPVDHFGNQRIAAIHHALIGTERQFDAVVIPDSVIVAVVANINVFQRKSLWRQSLNAELLADDVAQINFNSAALIDSATEGGRERPAEPDVRNQLCGINVTTA